MGTQMLTLRHTVQDTDYRHTQTASYRYHFAVSATTDSATDWRSVCLSLSFSFFSYLSLTHFVQLSVLFGVTDLQSRQCKTSEEGHKERFCLCYSHLFLPRFRSV